MASNNPEIFPKTTRSIETDADQITDSAFFMALSTGVFPTVSAVKNETDAQCPDGNPVTQCEAVRESVGGTLQLMQDDANEGFTGWVGYERTNTDCTDCSRTCTTTVYWEDGKPTEKMRFLFTETPENEVVIRL